MHLTVISAILISLGILLLLAAMGRTGRIMGILKERGPWGSLRNLMAFFALGYAVYLIWMLLGRPFNKDLLVSEVFFLSALFILLIVRYAYRTIHDVMRLDELELLANTDELTGVFNRRAILRLLDEEFWKARRFGFPLGVAMVDIDLFKDVNDEYGHLSGDLVLTAVAKRLRTTLRRIDLVGRYGGEEFLCILPSTHAEGVYVTGERVRRGISVLRFFPGPEGDLRLREQVEDFQESDVTITVSVGVATLDGAYKNPTELMAASDAALYRAKEEGRDMTIVGTPDMRHPTEG